MYLTAICVENIYNTAFYIILITIVMTLVSPRGNHQTIF
jgi:hypothetical protein